MIVRFLSLGGARGRGREDSHRETPGCLGPRTHLAYVKVYQGLPTWFVGRSILLNFVSSLSSLFSD